MLWNKLKLFLQANAPLAIAFSGGLDSRFLAFAAKSACIDVLLLHAQGIHVPKQETAYAIAWAKQQAIAIKCVNSHVLDIEEVKENGLKRCYFCKKYLLGTFKNMAIQEGLKLCDGTNADDMQSYRPGLQALKELEILSPLAILGFSKEMIRTIGAKKGLDNIEQKARPCLLTRLDYGLTPEQPLLKRIADAEFELEQAGLKDFRLRFCPKPVLQSLSYNISQDDIKYILKKHGFDSVDIYITEQISGFFDKTHLNQ